MLDSRNSIALPGGGGRSGIARRRRVFFIYFFFAEGDFFLGAFPQGNALFWEVVVGKSIFFIIFADFCQFLAIFTFLVHFHIALWEGFWPFFRYFWDSLGFSGGPTRIISPILGPLWPFLTIFGPFLDQFFFAFFDRKSRKPPKNKMCGCVAVWGFFI